MRSDVRRGVFLDRDGTLIEEVGYLDRIDRVRFFPYSIDAVRLLNRAGVVVIVATNQAGIARGFFDEAFVEATHRIARGDARRRWRARRRLLFLPASSRGRSRSVPSGVRLPEAAAGPAAARRGRSSDRSAAIVRRRRSRARHCRRHGRRRARSARAHRLRRSRRTLGPRRRGRRRQSHGRGFLDSRQP